MSPTSITSPNAPAPIGPYSPALLSPPLLFLSGQIGLDPHTKLLVPGGIAPQTLRALDNLTALLEAAGLHWGHVVKTDIFLLDLAHFPLVNELYGSRLSPNRPAPSRTTIQVAALPLHALVEISCIATTN
jgi:2-iminobutanoate/2-iminopropanoate deaminase